MVDHSDNIVLILILIPLFLIFVGLYALDVACPLIYGTCGLYLLTVITIIAIVKLMTRKRALSEKHSSSSHCLIPRSRDPVRKSCCSMVNIEPSKVQSKAISWPLLLNVENVSNASSARLSSSDNVPGNLKTFSIELKRSLHSLNTNAKIEEHEQESRKKDSKKGSRCEANGPGHDNYASVNNSRGEYSAPQEQTAVIRCTASFQQVFQVEWETCQDFVVHPHDERFATVALSLSDANAPRAQPTQPKVLRNAFSNVSKSVSRRYSKPCSNSRVDATKADISNSRSRTILSKFRPTFVQRSRNKLRKHSKSGSLLLDSQYVQEICRSYSIPPEDLLSLSRSQIATSAELLKGIEMYCDSSESDSSSNETHSTESGV